RPQRREVQQAQVNPVLLIAGDALVVVDAAAATIQDELAPEHLNRARVMRGMTVHQVDAAADQPVSEADLIRVHVIPPVGSPVDGEDRKSTRLNSSHQITS